MLDFLSPNLMALIAAVFVAMARTLYRAGLARISPFATTVVMALTAVVAGLGGYLLEGGMAHWPLAGFLWFMGVGLASGSAGRYFSLVSINQVGLARTSVVMQTSLAWSAALAVAFLGETMTWPVGLGTVAIMFGAALLALEGKGGPRRIPLRCYLVPTVTAVVFGLAHMSGKFGLRSLPSAPLGMVISSGTGLILMLGALPFSQEANPLAWDRRGLATVTLGGACNALAALFFWSALKGGEVVQVVPINRLSVLLIIFFSWFFFRKQEAIGLRVVVGGALSVAGAFAVAWGK